MNRFVFLTVALLGCADKSTDLDDFIAAMHTRCDTLGGHAVWVQEALKFKCYPHRVLTTEKMLFEEYYHGRAQKDHHL